MNSLRQFVQRRADSRSIVASIVERGLRTAHRERGGSLAGSVDREAA
jgi:hypothetical protein